MVIMILVLAAVVGGLDSGRGSNNGSWKGGITPLHRMIRTNNKYLEWKYKIARRDKICQICGCKKHDSLIIHHNISLSKILQYSKSERIFLILV